MSAHPLTIFVYETFGQQFGDLLLAGYGAEPGGGRKKLYLTESEAGVETRWVIELIARRPPCRNEPLVMAALLKLLLSRSYISHQLEFKLEELLAELQWRDVASTRRKVETTIVSYVRQVYDKHVGARVGRHTSATADGGYYHLLTGYVRGIELATSRTLARIPGNVYFDGGFIRGLKDGRVYFAGIDFGLFKQPSE